MDDLCRRVQFGTVDNRALGTASLRPPKPRLAQQLWRAALGMLALTALSCVDSGLPEGPVTGPELEKPARYREAAESVGISFRHSSGARGDYHLPEIMGSGAALFDYDSDGDLDAYLIQSGVLDPAEGPPEGGAGDPPANRMFRNLLAENGMLEFDDVTDQSGLGDTGYGMGVAVGDIDGDGDLDLYVTNVGSNVLFRNNGHGTFSDITQSSRTDDPRWNVSASFFDYDQDQDLDLFVTAYVDFTPGALDCFHPSGARGYCSPKVYRPIVDRLFENRGGVFQDVTQSSGIGETFGAGLGVACSDFNGDGWTDVFVANDGTPNQLWINQGGESFVDRGLISGTAYNAMGQTEAGMGIAAGDFDQDGDEDLFLTHLIQETNTLYENDGEGNFVDATTEYGLGELSLRMTGFGTRWLDLDQDGDLDLFVANGAVTALESLLGQPFPYPQPNQLVRREESGFRLLGPESGVGHLIECTRGAAFGDVDNDGDIDILLNNNGGPARLLLNQTASSGHSIQLSLEGEENRHGVGARVVVTLGDGRQLWRHVQSDGSYASASDLRVHFGLGEEQVVRSIEIRWPSGQVQMLKNVAADQILGVKEPAS